jgi:hypothetical protein
LFDLSSNTINQPVGQPFDTFMIILCKIRKHPVSHCPLYIHNQSAMGMDQCLKTPAHESLLWRNPLLFCSYTFFC